MAPQLAERAEPILVAAEQLFAERGYGAVGIADVADEVGLPEQHVYNYVGSKETLMLACHRRGRMRLLAMLDAPPSDFDDPQSYLRAGLTAILTFARDHAEGWHILEAYARTNGGPVAVELERGRKEFLRLISQVITEVRAANGADPGGVNTQTTAAAIVGAIDAVAIGWWQRNSQFTPEEVAAQMAATLWGGLQAELGAEPV